MRCDTCGNDYDKTFKVIGPQGEFIFDSLECAIQKLAPTCAHCRCRVIGHGVETEGTIYCCEHCERQGRAAEATKARRGAAHGTH
jgi:hypothetical protein